MCYVIYSFSDCDFCFRLVLVTTSLSRELPSELVAATTVVVFWPEVGGVRDLLLDRFLWQQNSKTAQEREHLRHVRCTPFLISLFSLC